MAQKMVTVEPEVATCGLRSKTEFCIQVRTGIEMMKKKKKKCSTFPKSFLKS